MVLMSLNSFDLDGNIGGDSWDSCFNLEHGRVSETVVYLGDSWNIKHHEKMIRELYP